MEREQFFDTEFEAPENDLNESSAKFPKLLIAAAIIFAINILVVLYFYFAPSFGTNFVSSNMDEETTLATVATKISPFEPAVNDTPHKVRLAERMHPVLTAVPQPETQVDSTAQVSEYAPATGTPVAIAYTSPYRSQQ
jgi:hypothetical protein